jgi:putative cardiolipin synthase
MTGCASLPPLQDRIASTALTDTADTRLGRDVTPHVAAHPGKSGVKAFPAPRDAFAARMLLAALAEKSLDAQYFIWHGDQVGYLLFEAIWNAAGRGVRVRLLLDDANTGGLDPTIAALDAHPNIEVRLYNPFTERELRDLGYLTDFHRLNRRMHNKSFTVDNQYTVVGGRNIANEYFGADTGVGFMDIDVMATGAVVPDVSKEFDIFWNSASAYPAAGFVGAPGPDGAAMLQAKFAAMHEDPVALAYLKAVSGTPLIAELANPKAAFEWIIAQVVYDDPAKTLDTTDRTDVLLFPKMIKKLGRPERTVDIVSPYFVPGDDGAAMLTDLARRGVNVRVLTNSLAASDESVVHAGYMKHRKDLLQAGVALYELKPTAATGLLKPEDKFGAAHVAGLHGKTYAVDRSRIFVGSFNFDQRSARLNTEMGLVLNSPVLAGQLSAFFDESVPLTAYEVRLSTDGNGLVWIERTKSGEVKHYDADPDTSGFKRWWVEFLSTLPIDWLL